MNILMSISSRLATAAAQGALYCLFQPGELTPRDVTQLQSAGYLVSDNGYRVLVSWAEVL